MRITALDGEWTVTWKQKQSKTSAKSETVKDGTPYNPNNKLVCLQYKQNTDIPAQLVWFNHNELPNIDKNASFKIIQDVLDRTDLLVGHNLKADLAWLLEAGFTIKPTLKLFDTMVFEYFKAKGMKLDLSLEATCNRWKVAAKKDTLSNYLDKMINVDAIPHKELEEYGIQDVESTYELFVKQRDWFKTWEHRAHATPILKVMNDFIFILVEMERSGVKIDMKALKDVENQFQKERADLEAELYRIVREAVGDTPINFQSSEQLSQIIYSRKVTDKNAWKEVFNIGTEIRNGVSKKKYASRLSPREFNQALRELTTTTYKTVAVQCTTCQGQGKVRKVKKDGTLYAKGNICQLCNGAGIVYGPTEEVAGFRVTPLGPHTASDGGFSTNSDIIDTLLESTLNAEAIKFLSALSRYNSLTTYLNNFVGGIENNVHNEILHIPFNNTVTATGRLSSPFHNIPKGKTFPIKKAFVSRFKGGVLLNADASALEFRVAAMLSGCPHAKAALDNKIDIHTHTSETLRAAGEDRDRDASKPFTFKPLYGGQSGTPAQKAWFTRFLEWFSGIDSWQKKLGEEALLTKEIKSPSGRIYSFPFTKRFPSGRVSSFTQICNYPVQGVGSDIVELTLIVLKRELLKAGATRSVIIMNVHDSVVLDVPPEEKDLVVEVFKKVIDMMPDIIISTFHISSKDITIPWEIAIGETWMDVVKIA